jgi:hypothetical protein
MRGIGWIFVALCLSAGCFDTPQAVLDDLACRHICDCVTELDCQDTCLQFVAPVTQDCFDTATSQAQNCAAILAAIDDGGVCDPERPGPEE